MGARVTETEPKGPGGGEGSNGGDPPRWAVQLMAAQKVIVGVALGIAVLFWLIAPPQVASIGAAVVLIGAGLVLWRADRAVKRARSSG